MYNELDRIFPGEHWDKAAHEYFALLEGKIMAEGRYAFGLFSGVSGLLFVLHRLAERETSYVPVRNQVAASLLTTLTQLRIPTDHPHPDSYGLSTGAVGIGATLLTLAEEIKPEDQDKPGWQLRQLARRKLMELIRHLAWLGKRDIVQDVEAFNHWYHSPELHETQLLLRAEGSAYNGIGMWYGLAGLISLLSLTLTSHADIHEEEAAEALQTLCTQMRKNMHKNEQKGYWTQKYTGDEYHRPGKCVPFAWCNGTAGIARSLWLAGRALQDSSLSTLALECISEAVQCFRRNPTSVGPSLCHGLAGLTLVCSHFVQETADPNLADDMRAMTSRLLELFEVDRPFGYRNFEPEYLRSDSPWLLEGAAGVVLALLATVSPFPPAWDRLLLLA